VSFENINSDNLPVPLTLSPLVLREGAQADISKLHLDSTRLRRSLNECGMRGVEIQYVVDDVPKHGVLEIRGVNATRAEVFTQKDVNKGYVTYTHDNSESLWDVFTFNVYMEMAVGGGTLEKGGAEVGRIHRVSTKEPIGLLSSLFLSCYLISKGTDRYFSSFCLSFYLI